MTQATDDIRIADAYDAWLDRVEAALPADIRAEASGVMMTSGKAHAAFMDGVTAADFVLEFMAGTV